MDDYVVLDVDVSSPSDVKLVINGGADTTVAPLVNVMVSCQDDLMGQNDIRKMKVWGDVDTDYSPFISTTSGASEWISWIRKMPVMLSATAGTKTLNVSLMDSVGNTSSTVSSTITLGYESSSVPVPIILYQSPINRLSLTSGYNSGYIYWRTNRAIDEYAVKLVSTTSATHTEGTVISGTNVSGVGTWAALSAFKTTFTVSNLLSISSGTGLKVLKIFLRSGTNWSA